MPGFDFVTWCGWEDFQSLLTRNRTCDSDFQYGLIHVIWFALWSFVEIVSWILILKSSAVACRSVNLIPSCFLWVNSFDSWWIANYLRWQIVSESSKLHAQNANLWMDVGKLYFVVVHVLIMSMNLKILFGYFLNFQRLDSLTTDH